MKRLLKTLIVALLLHQCVHAQGKLEIQNVYSVNLRSSGPILEGDQVKGYYFFYQTDNVNRKTNEYTLQILDVNLNKLKDIRFENTKTVKLYESSYNGNSLVFMFYDEETRMLDYRIYGINGDLKWNYTRKIDKKSEEYFEAYKGQTEDAFYNQHLYDIGDKGFISLIPVKDGRRFSYEISFFSTNEKKTWSYESSESENFTSATFIGSNGFAAYFQVARFKGMFGGKSKADLLSIDLSNGSKLFQTELETNRLKLIPGGISVINNSNNIVVMGPYYENNDRPSPERGLGIGLWVIDGRGKILAANNNSWQSDISKLVKVDSKGRIDGLGNIVFHKFLQTSDGNFFVIGEGYRYSGLSFKISDIVIFQLDEKFKLQYAGIYDKPEKSMNVYSAALKTGGGNGGNLASGMFSYANALFDYSFTQMGRNKNSFITTYLTEEKSKEYKGPVLNSITYDDNRYTTGKIKLKSEATRTFTMPAKPGSIVIVDYYKKEKRLDVRMEKLN
jgi:hypothetical protein